MSRAQSVRNPLVTTRCKGKIRDTKGCQKVKPHWSTKHRRKDGSVYFRARSLCVDCWNKAHRRYKRAYVKRKKGDPEFKKKQRARQQAQKYKIPDDAACKYCSSDYMLQRHHPDHDKPGEFEVLCVTCHQRVDKWAK